MRHICERKGRRGKGRRCCSTLQHTATHLHGTLHTLHTLQHSATHTETHCNTYTATHLHETLQHACDAGHQTQRKVIVANEDIAAHCNTLQHTHCNTLQHTHRSTLQQTFPKHCNTLAMRRISCNERPSWQNEDIVALAHDVRHTSLQHTATHLQRTLQHTFPNTATHLQCVASTAMTGRRGR